MKILLTVVLLVTLFVRGGQGFVLSRATFTSRIVSSSSHPKRLSTTVPIQILKQDQSFIKHYHSSPKSSVSADQGDYEWSSSSGANTYTVSVADLIDGHIQSHSPNHQVIDTSVVHNPNENTNTNAMVMPQASIALDRLVSFQVDHAMSTKLDALRQDIVTQVRLEMRHDLKLWKKAILEEIEKRHAAQRTLLLYGIVAIVAVISATHYQEALIEIYKITKLKYTFLRFFWKFFISGLYSSFIEFVSRSK